MTFKVWVNPVKMINYKIHNTRFKILHKAAAHSVSDFSFAEHNPVSRDNQMRELTTGSHQIVDSLINLVNL